MAPSILELRDQPQTWSTQPKLEPESLPLCTAPHTGERAAIHLCCTVLALQRCTLTHAGGEHTDLYRGEKPPNDLCLTAHSS